MTRRRRLLIALVSLPVIAGVVIALAVLARADSSRTYEGLSFGLSYPADWRPVEVRFPNPELGGGPRSPVVTFGLDRDNWVSAAQVAPTRRPVGAGDYRGGPARRWPGFRAPGIFGSWPGRQVRGGPSWRASSPRSRHGSRFAAGTGTEAEDRQISVYSGRTQYAINCQHARGAPAERREVVAEGCEQVLATFQPAP